MCVCVCITVHNCHTSYTTEMFLLWRNHQRRNQLVDPGWLERERERENVMCLRPSYPGNWSPCCKYSHQIQCQRNDTSYLEGSINTDLVHSNAGVAAWLRSRWRLNKMMREAVHERIKVSAAKQKSINNARTTVSPLCTWAVTANRKTGNCTSRTGTNGRLFATDVCANFKVT